MEFFSFFFKLLLSNGLIPSPKANKACFKFYCKMDKKYIAYALIWLGASDLLIWVVNDFSFGWFEFVVGVNVISKYGAWLMIICGIWFYNQQRVKEESEIDLLIDLDKDEVMLYKHVGMATIICLTNKKIIYRAHNLDQQFINNHNDIVKDEKAIFEYADIETARPVKTKDTGSSKLARTINVEFGIQLLLKDGSIKNLPTSKSELICSHIVKNLNN